MAVPCTVASRSARRPRPGASLAGAVATTTLARGVEHYAAGVHAAYEASLASATELDAAIDAFVADPTDETLEAAKQAWLAARDDYGLTEAFRFYGGPIDDEETGPEGRSTPGRSTRRTSTTSRATTTAGIVNDPDDLPDDRRRADHLAQRAGRRGQHLDRLARHRVPAVGPGPLRRRRRAPGRSPTTPTADNADRRAHLPHRRRATCCSSTSPASSTRGRRTPTTTGPSSSPRSPTRRSTTIITGIGELTRGELAGERMNVAYEERSQEDEHSCFSDNTTTDLVANALGHRDGDHRRVPRSGRGARA